MYHLNVVRSFLKAGVPLTSFRDALEECGFSLSGCQQLSEMILQQEKIKEEIAGKQLSVIFDGTTHVEEVFNVIVRFVDEDFEIKQR